MSKPTILKKSNTSNAKIMGTKKREPSKERNTTKKVNAGSTENVNIPTAKIKSKPAVKLKESLSSNTTIKNGLKHDSTKVETKIKPESRRSNPTTTSKPSPTMNKVSTTSSKTSSNLNRNNLTKSKRLTAPDTPPSNRVTKTQFFPSKKMYSNAVKEHLQSTSSNEKINNIKDTVVVSSKNHSSKSKTLDHSGIKIAKQKSESITKNSEKSQSHNQISVTNVERPRTATLRKGSIVNSNIAGPDIPKSETPSLTSLDSSYEQENQQEDNYEDDFDSYESDFEEYQSSTSTSLSEDDNLLQGEESTTSDDTSSPAPTPKQGSSAGTDEERMLDSGNFDMPENKHKQLLDNIKESSEQENFAIVLTDNNRSNMASLSDEGFEEGKPSLQSGNMQFINFVEAQKKCKLNKNLEKRRKRGEEILNMIRLDQYNFTLFEMPPVSYDVFIRSYGKTNTIQVPTQTGDDNISEEIQTDDTEMINKWTQFPAAFTKIDSKNSNYLELYKQEYAGVGSDALSVQDSSIRKESINNNQLEKFLLVATQTIINILNESQCSTAERIEKNSREIPFSSGYIKFNVKSCAFLKNRPISYVTYCSMTNIKILTVHGCNSKDTDNLDEDLSLKSVICIWSIWNSEKPEKMLSVTGNLNCCCFISEYKNIIVGGLCDGSLTTWDLDEHHLLQKEALSGPTNKTDYFQEPNYTSEIGFGHSCKVVAVQQMLNWTDDLFHSSIEQKSSNNQICSLDENGTLIMWGIIMRDNSFNSSVNHSVAPWNHLSLVQNSTLSLKDFNPDLTNLLCTDMNINILDPHHIFISTNYGCVIHCLTTGTKPVPKKYSPVIVAQANCLEVCPFSPLYFFAGHEDGAIILYSRQLEKPLMMMSNKEDDTIQSGIELLQWSYHKPCIFYAKDHYNTIHVWDLTISDLYPVYSVPFRESITCMKLSPTLIKNNDTSYMILATKDGSVHLHLLNPEYGPSDSEKYQQDVKKFLNYVSRL